MDTVKPYKASQGLVKFLAVVSVMILMVFSGVAGVVLEFDQSQVGLVFFAIALIGYLSLTVGSRLEERYKIPRTRPFQLLLPLETFQILLLCLPFLLVTNVFIDNLWGDYGWMGVIMHLFTLHLVAIAVNQMYECRAAHIVLQGRELKEDSSFTHYSSKLTT